MAYYIAAQNTSNFRFLKSIIFKSTLNIADLGTALEQRRFHELLLLLPLSASCRWWTEAQEGNV